MSKTKLQVITTNEIDSDNWDTEFTHSGDKSAFDKYKPLSKLRGLEDLPKNDNPVKIKNAVHNRKNAFQNIKNLFKFKKVCPCFD
jgi:hypothetical protein